MDPEELNRKAQACYNAGLLYDAYDLYTSLLSLKDDASAYNDRAIVALRLNKLTSALTDIEKAIEMSDNSSAFYKTKAAILLKQSRAEDALQCIEKALDLDNSLENNLDKIVVLRKLKRYEEALKMLDLLNLESLGFNLQIQKYHGIVLFEASKFSQAQRIFQEIILKYPGDFIARLYLARIKNLN